MTTITKDKARALPYDRKRLENYVIHLVTQSQVSIDEHELQDYFEDVHTYVESRDTLSVEELNQHLIMQSQSRVAIGVPEWDTLSAQVLLHSLYKRASKTRYFNPTARYGDLYGLINSLVREGIFDTSLIEQYSKEDYVELQKIIDPKKDELFTYQGLDLLSSRYLVKTVEGAPMELPQERWLIIAMYLLKDEQMDRLKKIKQAYWAMSNLYITMATPTMANAGHKQGQLSSCFISAVDDSLEAIYQNEFDLAQVSKYGGGCGTYLGFLRSSGSDIRGVANASNGVVPWIKGLNNVAVAVDQLGKRKGAINITLDVFHKDILPFLDLRLNNGDARLRAHDIFTTVSIPDVFMKAVEKRSEFYLFDPHEVYTKKGWYLQDFYDETTNGGSFTDKYNELIADNSITKTRVNAIDIMKAILKSQLENGTPFMFYRDTVNRLNPNAHKGLIYATNLCTEITQNLSVSQITSTTIDGDKVVTTEQAGDFVVCNLSSLNLAKFKEYEKDLLDLISIQTRMLDNVITLNNLPTAKATITNNKYRAIGIGTFGIHHLYAKEGIMWGSDEALRLNELVYSQINYYAIEASVGLAVEKGAYPLFNGSDWQTGSYFEKRNLLGSTLKNSNGDTINTWDALAKVVAGAGLRNGYLMAVAPNTSTAQIAGTTASIDPVFDRMYYQENKKGRQPVLAPDLTLDTYDIYTPAVQVNQFDSVKQNAIRQRYIDQAISFNLYIPSKVKVKVVLDLHMSVWKSGIKTTYYVRSRDTEVEDCQWCQ